MRRLVGLFAALGLIFFGLSASAQMLPLTGAGGASHVGGFTPSCTESSNFLTRATTITLTVDKTNYDTLICGLVSDGVFSLLDVLYIYAAPDTTAAKLNLVSSSFTAVYGGTTSESGQFSAYHGYAGDAANSVTLNTQLTPSSGGLHYVQDDASYGFYDLTNRGVAFEFAIGQNAVNNTFTIPFRDLSGTNSWVGQINSGGSDSVTNSSSQGFYHLNRSGGASVEYYKNGSSIGSNSRNSDQVPNAPFYILDTNSGSGFGTSDRLSAAFIGASLNSTKAGNLSSRINAFMTAYGINVY